MLKKIASSLSENGADAWVIYDFASQNPAFVSIFGKNFSTRKCFAVIDKAMNNTLICHSIDALGIGKAEVTKNFRLKVYNTWQQLDLLLEETLSDYDTVMMEISENGLMPRSSYVDYGTVCSVKRFVKNIISSADLFQALAATFFGESLEFHKKAAITVNAIKDEAFDLISRTVRQKGLVSEYEIQQFILKRFSDNGMVTDSAPIVAIEKNAASPHYEPTKDNHSFIRKGNMVLNVLGLVLAVLSVITGLWHQQTVGWDQDMTLLIISFVFAFTHCAFYMYRIWKNTHENTIR